MSPPSTSSESARERAKDHFDIPLGALTRSSDTGKSFLFQGWRTTTVGHSAEFIEPYLAHEQPWEGRCPRYTYSVVFTNSLLKKFPDLIQYRRAAA